MDRANDLTVRQVMGDHPILVTADTPIQEALRRMNLDRVGAVLIVEEGDLLRGIFTERDLLKQSAMAAPGWRQTAVGTWMTPDPVTIGPEAKWEDAAAMLEGLRIRHLPVVEDGRVVGIISARRLIAWRNEFLNGAVERRTAELREANGLLLAREQEMRHNLKVAGRLQTRLLLPQKPPDWSEVGWGVHYVPLDPLGGDYYDFARPDDDHVGVLIADATGHGIPAAMVAIMARIAFGEVAPHTTRPGEVLAAMNARLQGLTDDRFVTAFYGMFDRRGRTFTYANAGHPDPLRYVAATGQSQQLSARGFLLGIVPDESYEEKTIRLEPGDRLCFHTDGLLECANEIGWTFGGDRLERYLSTFGHRTATELMHDLLVELAKFRGDHPMGDDLTVLFAEIR
jgi:sigma-B regulation protein RsbU (phosphoserine phosphatase)